MAVCKYCKHWKKEDSYCENTGFGECKIADFDEYPQIDAKDKMTMNWGEEGGYFLTEEAFGCIHFSSAENEKICDNCKFWKILPEFLGLNKTVYGKCNLLKTPCKEPVSEYFGCNNFHKKEKKDV
jgi:hypothetical protein